MGARVRVPSLLSRKALLPLVLLLTPASLSPTRVSTSVRVVASTLARGSIPKTRQPQALSNRIWSAASPAEHTHWPTRAVALHAMLPAILLSSTSGDTGPPAPWPPWWAPPAPLPSPSSSRNSLISGGSPKSAAGSRSSPASAGSSASSSPLSWEGGEGGMPATAAAALTTFDTAILRSCPRFAARVRERIPLANAHVCSSCDRERNMGLYETDPSSVLRTTLRSMRWRSRSAHGGGAWGEVDGRHRMWCVGRLTSRLGRRRVEPRGAGLDLRPGASRPRPRRASPARPSSRLSSLPRRTRSHSTTETVSRA